MLMTRSTDTIEVSPLFYDALSGEFYPPTDPDRAHTLARLAIGAFRKGEAVGLVTAQQTGYQYTPSWAKAVDAIALTEQTPDDGIRLSGLILRTDGDRLEIQDRGQGLKIPTHGDLLPLERGTKLRFAQSHIVHRARSFFNHMS